MNCVGLLGMNEHDDWLNDGRFIERKEIADDDHLMHCLRCKKELYIDFTNNVVKPCKFSAGIDIKNYDEFFQYIKDINNDIKRPECNYCHEKDPEFRLLGNALWLRPGHGNSHTEIVLSDDFDEDILTRYVTYIAEDYHKFACICIAGYEPGYKIIEQNHVELIAKPFFAANKLKFRRLRYDFKTKLDFSVQRARQIAFYLKKMQKRYPRIDFSIQPENYAEDGFVEKMNVFVYGGFEITTNTDEVNQQLFKIYGRRDNIKLPPGFEYI